MKGNGFGDRTRCLAEWFQDWNSCEQIIALYPLLSKVSATQARFLSFVLDHSLKNGCDSQELSKLEKEANSTAFLKSIYNQSDEEALSLLLSHLPLLNPGNSEARTEYRNLIPKVMMGGSNEEPDYRDKCKQLLSLAMVHPAFLQEDRKYLNGLLSQLDAKHKNMEGHARPLSPLTATHGPSHQIPVAQQPPALPPRIRQVPTVDDANHCSGSGRIYIDTHPHDQPPLPSDPDDEEVQRTLSLEKSPAVPRVGGATAKEDFSSVGGNMYQDPGMKDVPMWLKSLRLHKYQSLFAGCMYEQMLNIDESYLEEKNVTKGARTKLTLCIRKLARRPETLAEIEQDMEKHGHLVQCFSELRQMLQTPIKPYSPSQTRKTCAAGMASQSNKKAGFKAGLGAGSGDEDERAQSPQPQSSSDNGSDLDDLLAKDFPQEDLPSLITRAIGKGFSQLMMHTDTNEENLTIFLKLLDNALQHEVFTTDQKKLFFDWMQQSTQTLRVISSKKTARGGRQYERSVAYTMPANSRSVAGYNMGGTIPGGLVTGGSGGTRVRSMKGSVIMRNGSPLKGMSLPGSATSSTLPRMSARQLQQPIPHATPSFLRHSAFIQPSTVPVTVGQLLSHHGGQGFQPHNPPPIPPPPLSSSSPSSAIAMSSFLPSSSGAPPPLPPRTYEISDTDMDDLCKRVTDHALPDDMSDN